MRAALLSVPGVRTVDVNFEQENARVEYDPERASLDDMVQALDAVGYQAWDTASEISRTRKDAAPAR